MPARRWTRQEVESLVHQIVAEHRSLPHLQVPGKTQAAINNQRRRLKNSGVLNGAFQGRRVKPWTIRELKQLTTLTTEYGFSAEFIAQLQLIPGRSKDSIGKMMGRTGLGNAAVKERARRARRLRPDERRQFERYLLEEGRLVPAAEVARKWGIAQKTVNAYRRRLGVPLTWQQARSSEEYQRKQKECAREFRERTLARWREWLEQKRQTFERLKREWSNRVDPPAARTCQSCGEQWFATAEFFPVQTRTLGRRRKTTMSRTCRLCRSARKRSRKTAVGAAHQFAA